MLGWLNWMASYVSDIFLKMLVGLSQLRYSVLFCEMLVGLGQLRYGARHTQPYRQLYH
jgi:hypothetical protein